MQTATDFMSNPNRQKAFEDVTQHLRVVFTDGSSAPLQTVIKGFVMDRETDIGQAMLAAAQEADPRVTAIYFCPPAQNDNDKQPDFAALATEIHGDNVKVGWWTDLKTGESTLRTRNRPEMLMLAVSELAEAAEGAHGMMDDKLPHLPMYDVELADFVIRQFDQIGAEVSCGAEMPAFENAVFREPLRAASRNDRLMELVMSVSVAMECYRKRGVDSYVRQMAQGIVLAFQIARIEHIDLLDIIRQKRAFNATRADHQIANRVKEGGKSF